MSYSSNRVTRFSLQRTWHIGAPTPWSTWGRMAHNEMTNRPSPRPKRPCGSVVTPGTREVPRPPGQSRLALQSQQFAQDHSRALQLPLPPSHYRIPFTNHPRLAHRFSHSDSLIPIAIANAACSSRPVQLQQGWAGLAAHGAAVGGGGGGAAGADDMATAGVCGIHVAAETDLALPRGASVLGLSGCGLRLPLGLRW